MVVISLDVRSTPIAGSIGIRFSLLGRKFIRLWVPCRMETRIERSLVVKESFRIQWEEVAPEDWFAFDTEDKVLLNLMSSISYSVLSLE